MSTIASTTVITDDIVTAPLLVSVSELARQRGRDKSLISRQVARLVAEQRLQIHPGPRGTKLVDVVEFDRAIGDVRERIVAHDEPQATSVPPGATYIPPAESGALTKAKTATEIYRARLAQLEYDERVGKVVLKDDVVRSIRAAGEAIAREIELFPTRADELAAAFRQNDVQGLRMALRAVARDLLATLSNSMKALAEGQISSRGGDA